MHIAFLNQYYEPFSASTSHLLTDVATSLAADGHRVSVITGRNAYIPEERDLLVPRRETLSGVDVIRVGRTYADRTNRMRRVLGYLEYLIGATFTLAFLDEVDLVVPLTTPPFLARVAATVAKMKRRRVALWLMDMYPDALAADRILDSRGVLYRALAWTMRTTYRACARIVVLDKYMQERLVSQGVDASRLRVCPNWQGAGLRADSSDDRQRFRRDLGIADDDLLVLYFGNLGLAHEVDTIVDVMDQLRADEKIKFAFIGGGTRTAQLRRALEQRNLDNVIIRPAVRKSEIAVPLRAADIGLVTMLDQWNGVLSPSKVYSIMAAGLPILYIGPERSEISDIIRDAGAGAAHVIGDVAGTVASIRGWNNNRLRLQEDGEATFAAFRRSFTGEQAISRVRDALLSAVADP